MNADKPDPDRVRDAGLLISLLLLMSYVGTVYFLRNSMPLWQSLGLLLPGVAGLLWWADRLLLRIVGEAPDAADDAGD